MTFPGDPRDLGAGVAANARARLETAERMPKLYPAVRAPAVPGPDGETGWWSSYMAPTGGAWRRAWWTWLPYLTHEAVAVGFGAITGAGTADVRLRITADGGVDVACTARSMSPGQAVGLYYGWLHELPLWTTTNVTLEAQARVADDTFVIFCPYGGGFTLDPPRDGMTLSGI